MRKILVVSLITIFLFIARPAQADEVAGQSASISYSNDTKTCVQTDNNNLAQKKLAIKMVLEKYNSPLSDNVDDFISTCSKYGIDCYLLPSIAGLESTFGRFILPGSNNGWGWGGGYIMFNSWKDGMDKVASGLKYSYIARGADSIDKIGPIYSESPTWAVRVNRFMDEFKQAEAKLTELNSQNKVGVL